MIELATRSSFEVPKPVTAVVVDRAPTDSQQLRELKTLQVFGDGTTLVTIPRYEGFTVYARGLSQQGLRFVEIAGNRNFILVSLLTSDPTLPSWAHRVVIEQPYLTRPGWRRVAVAVLLIAFTDRGRGKPVDGSSTSTISEVRVFVTTASSVRIEPASTLPGNPRAPRFGECVQREG